MHVAILGAGALGCAYAAHLERAGVAVSLVTRRFLGRRWTTAHSPYPGSAGELRASECKRVPTCDLVLLSVRCDQLRGNVQEQLAAQPAPIVSLTPLMPQLARDLGSLAPRIYPAMPSLLASRNEHAIVYWTPPLASTLIDPRPLAQHLAQVPFGNSARDSGREVHSEHEPLAAVRELVRRLALAGLNTRLGHDVAARNVATTTAFLPLTYGVYLCGGLASLTANQRTWPTVRAACGETLTLARRLGPIEPPLWALATSARTGLLKPALPVLDALATGIMAFISNHFGTKLEAQHHDLAAEVLALGRRFDQPLPAFHELVSQPSQQSA